MVEQAVKHVAVFAVNQMFLPPILRELSQRRCIVKQWFRSDSRAFDLIQMYELMIWADVAFFDFCHDPLPMGSRMSESTRVVARLHGLEVYAPYMKVIDWSRVHLVCSEPQALRFEREVGATPASITKIGIGVSIEPTCKPKEVFGHNIGIIAYTPLPRKRIYTTIESFVDLLQQSQKLWSLHVRGASTTGYRDAEAKEYLKFIDEFKHTLEAVSPLPHGAAAHQVIFHPFMERKKYEGFLKGLDIIISNSMQEGYHQSVMEAASYGAYPLVHKWLGANIIYPQEYLFLTQRELVDRIIEWGNLTMEKNRIASLKVQKWVRENHDGEECARRIVDVILGGEG